MLDHEGRELAVQLIEQQQVAIAHLVEHGDGVSLSVIGLADGVDGADVRDVASVANGHIVEVVADVLDETSVADGNIAQRGVIDTAVLDKTVGHLDGALAIAQFYPSVKLHAMTA